MNALRKFLAVAATSAALAASPATAQGWRDDGYRPGWDGRYWSGHEDYRYPPRYGYGYPGVEVGVTEIAICPEGYRLDASRGLCWPD